MGQDTPCKFCHWAEYSEDNLTQTGCKQGRLQKYIDAGSEVIAAYDEDKEFFVIKDRICPFYRDRIWGDTFKDKTEDQLAEILKYETMMSIHQIIFVRDDSTIDDIRKTIKSLNYDTEDLVPIKVTVVRHKRSKVSPRQIKEIFDDIDVPVIWRVENMLVDRDDTVSIHSIQKTVKSQYYTVCDAGFEYPEKYFDKVNTSIIDNLIRFGLVEISPGQDQGVIIPIHVHQYWYFHGDVENTIPENIRIYQKENDWEKVVYNLGEFDG